MRRPAPFLLPGSVVDDSAHLPGGLTEGGKHIVCGLCHRDTGIWLTLARTVIDKHSKG
jgi:hypothetical protein